MKKRLSNLSSPEQEKTELEYHQMDPVEFDELMSQAKTCATASIRLPSELVELLKVMAKLEGERGYQALARKWISERLQQETQMALRLSEMPLKEIVTILEGQHTK